MLGPSAAMAQDVRRNVLISEFMNMFGQFGKHLCTRWDTLAGREEQFVEGIYKIFSIAAGEIMGSFYLESAALGRLSPELRQIDRVLGGRSQGEADRPGMAPLEPASAMPDDISGDAREGVSRHPGEGATAYSRHCDRVQCDADVNGATARRAR